MLGEEHGGMNEVLANLYGVTGESKYLAIAQRFNHLAVIGPAMAQQDKLTGLHANTQIPKFVGTARQYATGEDWLKTASEFFWSFVVYERSYVIGGPRRRGLQPQETLQAFGPSTTETCKYHNMLKLTRHLFTWEPKAAIGDFYERALKPHPLPGTASHDVHTCRCARAGEGLQLAPRFLLVLHGTGVENHVMRRHLLPQAELCVNLFIMTRLSWKEKT
jgi:DUF1680 family protein